MQSKDAQILAQSAAYQAVELLKLDGRPASDFPVYLKSVADAVSDLAEEMTTVATSSVMVGQPNGAPQAYQQAVQNLNQGGVPVAAATPMKEDELWQYFVQNQDEFYDNRGEGDTTVSGGSKPDFRAKNLLDKSGRKQGLFLVSRKYGKQAPDFVWEALGQQPPGQGTPVPAATTAAPAPVDAPF